MGFLKLLFWCLLAFVVVVFAIGNWSWVRVNLWAGLIAEVNLPLLLLVSILLGLLPTLVYHHGVRWRLRQRLAAAERQIAELQATAAPSPADAARPVPAHLSEPSA